MVISPRCPISRVEPSMWLARIWPRSVSIVKFPRVLATRTSPRPVVHRGPDQPGPGRYAAQTHPGGARTTVETTGVDRSATNRERIEELTRREMERLTERPPRSAEHFERASKVMPAGVPSSFQTNDPWPVYIERGEGARVWDVDGSEYSDFHCGFGVMCVDHATPAIVAWTPDSKNPNQAMIATGT